MSWIRLDDRFADHPKFMDVSEDLADAALALWVRALGYCNLHETDGFIPRAAVRKLSGASDPASVASELVRVRLWDEAERGWVIHDYHDYQPKAEKSKAAKAETSQVRSEAGRRGAAARWQTDGKPMANASDPDGKRMANGPVSPMAIAIKPDGKPMAPVPVPVPVPESSSWSTRAHEDRPEVTGLGSGPVESSPPEHAAEASDAPNHVDATENATLAPSRVSNGQSDADPLPVVVKSSGPDLLTKASVLADAGNSFGVDMLDWAARGKGFRTKQRETIDRLYAEHMEGQANAERARAAKAELVAGPSTSRSGAPANQRDEQAMALWCDAWAKQHRESYPVTDRDFRAMRPLVARAESRARELGGDTRVSDVLNHIFARYLRISDNKLAAERYPLALLESRLPAIGEYRPQQPKTHRPPEPEPEFAPPPPGFGAMIADMFKPVSAPAPRSAGGRS